jgi:hypothetical protein
MKELLVKIDEKSLEEIASSINIKRMIGQFYGPCDALAFIIGVTIENGDEFVAIKDIKGLANHLADKLNQGG